MTQERTSPVLSIIRSRYGVRVGLLAATLVFLGAGCLGSTSTVVIPPGGIYRSDDRGITFHQRVLQAGGSPLSRIRPVQAELASAEPETIYLLTREGLFVTASAGDMWQKINVPGRQTLSISAHPRNPRILLASVVSQIHPRQGVIIKSVDQGATWVPIFTAPPSTKETGTIVRRRQEIDNFVMAVAHDPQAPETVYAVTSTGSVLVSPDGGMRWETRAGASQGITGIKISPDMSGLLMLRLSDGSLARSDDGGKTLEKVNLRRTSKQTEGLIDLPSLEGRGTTENTLSVFFGHDSSSGSAAVFVGTSAGLYRSTDQGDTWTRVNIPTAGTTQVPVVSVTQTVDGTLWAASNAVLFQSIDAGVTWRALGTPLPAPLRFLVTDNQNPRRIFLIYEPSS